MQRTAVASAFRAASRGFHATPAAEQRTRNTKVMVVNAGSSSLKYSLFESSADNLTPLMTGKVERIGESTSKLKSKALLPTGERKLEVDERMEDHEAAIKYVIGQIEECFSDHIREEVDVVGHRVVHGGPSHSEAAVIDDGVLASIQKYSVLAPLHNPHNLAGIRACRSFFAGVPQVAVFDTAFHATMPPEAYLYAIPREWSERDLRRYGFHGTSYLHLVSRAAQLLRKPASSLNLIVFHLGAGASACCVRGGRSIDTSMGITPLEGLVMATRCGDVDPGLPRMAGDMFGLDAAGVDKVLNGKSGVLGMCGEKDMKAAEDVVLELDAKGERATPEERDSGAPYRTAMDVFVHRMRKYLGAYMVHLDGKVDAVVFSGGVGENSPYLRSRCLANLSSLGFEVDEAKNEKARGSKVFEDISGPGARVRALVIATDEEASIARQSLEAIGRR
ncbi:acetate kinase [Hyaloraphidium curvatum]|nr:acetate kinase [Hyaloraphidium curvatum]